MQTKVHYSIYCLKRHIVNESSCDCLMSTSDCHAPSIGSIQDGGIGKTTLSSGPYGLSGLAEPLF